MIVRIVSLLLTFSSLKVICPVYAEEVSGAAPSAVPSSSAASATAQIDYKKFRDPFKEPAISETIELRSDLERYPVTDFKLTGVVTGPLRMRAMLVDPNKKTHYVSEKMRLGTREGVIIKITTRSLLVREKIVNPLGEIELFDTELNLDQTTTEAPAGS